MKNRGKRVFKKTSAPKKRKKEIEAVLQIKSWQKEIIKVFNNLERKIRNGKN